MPTITVDGLGIVISARPGEAVLTALVRCGYGHRVGCRRGGCGVCKVAVLRGEVEYPTTVAETVLTPQERVNGICLTCRAVPVSDLTIRTLDGDRIKCVAPLLAALAGAQR